MPSPIHVLIVEDSPDDAQLLLMELSRGGFDPVAKRVETAEEMRAALVEGDWDVVLSDYTLPASGPRPPWPSAGRPTRTCRSSS